MSETEELVESLWNDHITPENYGSKQQYFEHIFEQYKIFVAMADKISSRRNLTNTFFLTLHTFLITAAGFIYEKDLLIINSWLSVIILIVLLLLCYVWRRLLESYRQLNSAKFKVIGQYEKNLPTSPYWIAEWNALGEGKDPKLYKPLTDLESWVPAIFALMYIIGVLIILIQ